MVLIRNVKISEKKLLNEITEIHLSAFRGFFLSFMGNGFLNQMYQSYCEEGESGLLVAEQNGIAVGFLAYSGNLSRLYKHMLRKHLLPFAWYGLVAFLKKPSAFFHIIRALLKPREAKRAEKYVELASIGVRPDIEPCGIGSQLVDRLKEIVNFNEYTYITLETDAKNNDKAIHFYEKNGFVIERKFETPEGREMYEYRFKDARRSANQLS